jgi:hypothetical protein
MGCSGRVVAMRKGPSGMAAKPINDHTLITGAVGGDWASGGSVNWLTRCIFGYPFGPENVFPNGCGRSPDVVVFVRGKGATGNFFLIVRALAHVSGVVWYARNACAHTRHHKGQNR